MIFINSHTEADVFICMQMPQQPEYELYFLFFSPPVTSAFVLHLDPVVLSLCGGTRGDRPYLRASGKLLSCFGKLLSVKREHMLTEASGITPQLSCAHKKGPDPGVDRLAAGLPPHRVGLQVCVCENGLS